MNEGKNGILSVSEISIPIVSSSETLQVVGESGGEPLRTLLMSAAQGGWMSLGIFLGWATGKSTRALVEGAPSFFGSGRRAQTRCSERRGEARNRMYRGGTERRVGGVRRGTETICPHMLCPAYVGAASRKRENRSSETRNRLSARRRREEVGNEPRHLPRNVRGNECFRN